MMYLLSVLCMVGLTVALPVLPDPPKLPNSIVTAHQNQKFRMNTPKVDSVSSPVRNNNKEVKKYIVKTYKVSIPELPPPPELPPFDYSTLIKQKPQKTRIDDSVQSGVERYVVVKDIKPIEKPGEDFKHTENFKFQEIQPNKESKSLEEPKPVEEPEPVEEPKSAEELIPIEELTHVEEPKYIEGSIPINESTYIEEPKPEEELIPIEEVIQEEEPKHIGEPKPIEEPIPIKESTYVEEPKSVEEPKTAEEPKAVEHLDSSKMEPKEEPEESLEDIPVVIQFTIPITTFLSSIISKLPSLSSFGFSWPFHKPSIFSRPRLIDETYPY